MLGLEDILLQWHCDNAAIGRILLDVSEHKILVDDWEADAVVK